MNLILAVYSQDAFREYQLPPLNNADYAIVLRSDFFHLRRNLNLRLEVLGGAWSFKKDRQYRLRLNDADYNGEGLQDQDVLNLYVEGEKDITLIVKYVDSVFHPYEKFSLTGVSRITIGKEPENDITYDSMQLVSRHHAVIKRTASGYRITNDGLNGTYVNSYRIEKEEELAFGAYINIMGLSMVYLGDYLAVDVFGSGAVVNEKKLRKGTAQGRIQQRQNKEALFAPGKHTYHRAPRTFKETAAETIEIEAPPQIGQGKGQPLMMTIGPSLTMALPMVLGCMLMISPSSGGSSLSMYSGLVMSLMSAFIGVFWALQNVRYQKKEESELKKLRFESYSEYLIEKTEEVKTKYEQASQVLLEMYPSAAECLTYDETKSVLWNRNTTHEDYLKHRLGIGNIPFPISIQAPKKRFSMYKDELAEKPRLIKENFETLFDVPVVLDLAKNNLVGVIGGANKAGAIQVARVVSAQIAASNCYTDVKLGFVYDGERSNEADQWKFAKWLPHVWSEDKKTRYFAADGEGASDVFYELTKVFRSRMEEQQEKKEKDKVPKPYYVLFISEPSMLEGELIARYIFEKNSVYGLTTFILTERYEELPNACDFIIENTEQFQGMYPVYASEAQRQKIAFDKIKEAELECFARHLATLQVQEIEKGGEIPGSLTFFEMMEASRPQDLPVKEYWAKNRTYDNIKGMVGAKAGGVPCYLDVHEKYHGPHGLVAGTTGSGKSETLQTYMLSLAVNYSPDDIGFFIIDYKGGGMANLFDGLPHMVGQISNLSGNQVKRAMISIKSENRRRQRVFTEHGVNNINLYTRLYKNGEATLPVPHLFIIIDEFAELKREEPDFMRELISVAQVGRSLGVHMILATQKPSGTVDDNIWSNSKFRLCLRVQDKQDSNDMLHKPDAAYITQAGRCYLQVGNDEVYELFQSGYSGATYEENASTGHTEIAKLLNLSGRAEMTGNSVKLSQKKKVEYMWLEQVAACVARAQELSGSSLSEALSDQQELDSLLEQIYQAFWHQKLEYPKSQYNSDRLCDFIRLYDEIVHEQTTGDWIEEMLSRSAVQKVKLPQKKEKTQLDAVKEHLAAVAAECGYSYHMQLWMPVLPSAIYLEEFGEFRQHCYQNGSWPQEQGGFSLEIVVGKMDDPENQNQMPLTIDFAQTGHLAVFGSIVSGKSTLLQTMAYALIHRYTPEAVNLYALDFSSKMMSAIVDAPHVGGVMYETDLNKISKFFNMIHSILEERKILFGGGNYSQYVQMHGITLPAIFIFVDNYAALKEKTEEAYEEMMITLSKEGVSHGIYLIVSGGGIGMNDITSRVCENINLSLCLLLQERSDYIDLLHTNQIDVLPEGGVKGRGLAEYEGRILEYQAALAVQAENDYQRMERIRIRCMEMQKSWNGKAARRIPEIPKKPVWSVFRALEEYQNMLLQPAFLPVAYDAANAKVYGIPLRQIYCYIAYGLSRSGKTNFLKVCIQAAIEKQAHVCVIDNPGHELRSYEHTADYYAADEQAIFAYFQQLTPEFVARNQVKQELLKQDCEEDEILDEMSKKKPYFIFIADLAQFVSLIEDAEQNMKGFLLNIISKGRLHHIYFFSAVSIEDHKRMDGIQLYDTFTSYKTGLHFGGKVGDNPVLDYSYVSYQEQAKSEAPGVGCLPDVRSDEETAKIVIPLARR